LKRDPVLQGDRPFTEFTINDDATGELFQGGSPTNPNGVIASAVVGGVLIPATAFNADGSLRPFTPALDFYNFAPDNYLQVPLERWSAGALGRFELTPDVTASVELMYSAPHAAQQLAPSPFN